jgi:hypothetical protein
MFICSGILLNSLPSVAQTAQDQFLLSQRRRPFAHPKASTHGWYGILACCCGLMPAVWSVVFTGATTCGGVGGGDGVDTSSAEATEIVVAATNTAKIIERIAFPP